MMFSIFINPLVHGVPGVHGYMEFSSMCLGHKGKFPLPLHPLAASDTSLMLPVSRTFLFALNPELENNPPIISDNSTWKKKKYNENDSYTWDSKKTKSQTWKRPVCPRWHWVVMIILHHLQCKYGWKGQQCKTSLRLDSVKCSRTMKNKRM